MEKHENNLASYNFPVNSFQSIITDFEQMLLKYRVNTICGFNIVWDFQAILDSCQIFNCQTKILTTNTLGFNIFNRPKYKILDLMYLGFDSCATELIRSALLTGAIGPDGRKRNARTEIYSLQSFAKFFNIEVPEKDKHLALSDVLTTKYVLDCVLKTLDYEESRIEFGLIYRDSLFKTMQNLARRIWPDLAGDITYGWSIVVSKSEKICCKCSRKIGIGEKCSYNTVNNLRLCNFCIPKGDKSFCTPNGNKSFCTPNGDK
jgi:hypothetical protein